MSKLLAHATLAGDEATESNMAQPAAAYADAARRATDIAERDHLVRQAARARAAELDDWSTAHRASKLSAADSSQEGLRP